jgi:hypothetical protein
VHDNGWSTDLTVEVAGHGVVSHTGSAVLRLVADNAGLTAALSRTLARRRFAPVHDRGRVLTDLAVCIADGGRTLSDIAALRDQGELFGPLPSDITLWHALDEIDEKARARIAGVRATVRPPGVEEDHRSARPDPALEGRRRVKVDAMLRIGSPAPAGRG